MQAELINFLLDSKFASLYANKFPHKLSFQKKLIENFSKPITVFDPNPESQKPLFILEVWLASSETPMEDFERLLAYFYHSNQVLMNFCHVILAAFIAQKNPAAPPPITMSFFFDIT